MKLYILEPKSEAPWTPWYDKCFCFICRTSSAKAARRIAADNAADEGFKVWLSPKYSSCKELKAEGEEELIIRQVENA